VRKRPGVGNFSERRHRLEFTVASSGDAVSSYLVIDRVLELSSQLDTIRILEELVLKPPSHTGIHRCLEGVAEAEYRDRLSEARVKFRGPHSSRSRRTT